MAHGLRRTAFDQASYDYWTGRYGIVNVKDYGAVGDGVHDDTAAIQQAIGQAQRQGGGVVYLPIGNYRVSASLSINSNAITIQGVGIGINNGTAIQVDGNFDAISIANPSFRVTVRDLELSTAANFTPTSGWAIKIDDCQQVLVENVYIFNLFNGVGGFGASTISCYRVHLKSLVGDYGFYMTGNSASNPANVFDCVSCHVTSCASAQAYTIDNYANTFRLRGCASNANAYGVVMQNTSGIAANAPAIVIAQDLEIDHNTQDAMYLDAGSDLQVSNLWISSCTSHGIHVTSGFGAQLIVSNALIEFNGKDGIHLNGGQQIQMEQLNINGNQENGIYVNTSGRVQLDQMLVFNNSQASLGSYQGVQITGGTSNVAISNSRVGAINGASNTHGSNILIQGGSGNNIRVNNNDVRGALYYNLLNQATGSDNLIVNNLGYNAVGTITPPASPLASGTVYQNTTGTPITIYQPAYASTAGTAGSVAVALGTSSTPSTLYTQYVSGATSSTAPMTLPPLRVPPGWYYSFTISGTTLLDAQIQGE